MFFTTLWGLAATYERLPTSVAIGEGLVVLDDVLESDQLSYIQRGKYGDNPVAVKSIKVSGLNLYGIMKVRRADAPLLKVQIKCSLPEVL
jgi:hypothetical protein